MVTSDNLLHHFMTLSAVKDSRKKSLPSLPDEPHHPTNRFVLPKKTFGHTKPFKCSTHYNWFQSWPFLHYDEGQDVFCQTCVKAFELDRMKTSKNVADAY